MSALVTANLPRVRGILGCSDKDVVPAEFDWEKGWATDCPLDAPVRITIIGENFGSQNAVVNIGVPNINTDGQYSETLVACGDVRHDPQAPERNITCMLPGPTTLQALAEDSFVEVTSETGSSRYPGGSGRLSYKLCDPGLFHDQDQKFRCASCGAGKYSNQRGATACMDCNKGTYNSNITNPTSCHDCPIGKWQSEDGKSACQPCEMGKYASTVGAWQCQQCDAGTYVSIVQCRKCPDTHECRNGIACPRDMDGECSDKLHPLCGSGLLSELENCCGSGLNFSECGATGKECTAGCIYSSAPPLFGFRLSLLVLLLLLAVV